MYHESNFFIIIINLLCIFGNTATGICEAIKRKFYGPLSHRAADIYRISIKTTTTNLGIIILRVFAKKSYIFYFHDL